MRRIEELECALREFADQSDATILVLRSDDQELPPVVQCLEQLDGTPHFVYLDITPVGQDLTAYVDVVIASLLIEVEAIQRENPEDAGLLPDFPEACWSRSIEPLARLRMTFAHLAAAMPEDDERHLIVALLPSEIENRQVHSHVVGALLPQTNFEPWMARVRFVVRDDKDKPFVANAALNARAPGVVIFETHLSAGDIVGELVEDGANLELEPGQRLQALLQCAIIEVTLGQLPEAMAKFTRLYAYYTAHQIPEMQGLILLQIAEAFRQANAPERAHRSILAAVDLATEHKDLALMVNSSHALASHAASRGNHAEVEMACAIGAGAAKLLGFDDLHAEFLLRRGDAQAAQGNWAGALALWTTCANETRENGSYNMLLGALSRLQDYAARAGHREIANQYAKEIRDHQAIVEGREAT